MSMLKREHIERSDNLRLVSDDKLGEAKAALKLLEAFDDETAILRLRPAFGFGPLPKV